MILTSGVHALAPSPVESELAPCGSQSMEEVMAWLPRLGKALHLPVPSWITYSEGSQLPCREDTQQPFGEVTWGGTEAPSQQPAPNSQPQKHG